MCTDSDGISRYEPLVAPRDSWMQNKRPLQGTARNRMTCGPMTTGEMPSKPTSLDGLQHPCADVRIVLMVSNAPRRKVVGKRTSPGQNERGRKIDSARCEADGKRQRIFAEIAGRSPGSLEWTPSSRSSRAA